jgi:hypothetical protein
MLSDRTTRTAEALRKSMLESRKGGGGGGAGRVGGSGSLSPAKLGIAGGHLHVGVICVSVACVLVSIAIVMVAQWLLRRARKNQVKTRRCLVIRTRVPLREREC